MTLEAHFIDDLGLDSLDAVELVMAFEDEFGAWVWRCCVLVVAHGGHRCGDPGCRCRKDALSAIRRRLPSSSHVDACLKGLRAKTRIQPTRTDCHSCAPTGAARSLQSRTARLWESALTVPTTQSLSRRLWICEPQRESQRLIGNLALGTWRTCSGTVESFQCGCQSPHDRRRRAHAACAATCQRHWPRCLLLATIITGNTVCTVCRYIPIYTPEEQALP